jgi:hypothetical protein
VPGQFPPGFASLSGDVETISRFLNAPTYIERTSAPSPSSSSSATCCSPAGFPRPAGRCCTKVRDDLREPVDA